MSPPSGDRSSLLDAKLKVLARNQWGDAPRASHPFPGGAALLSTEGATGWVLLDEPYQWKLGGPLTWAHKVGATTLHVIVDDASAGGLVARRAGHVAQPAVSVWLVDGTGLAPASPAPVPAVLPVPDAPELRDLFVDLGLEVVEEAGSIRGERRGLELARIVADPEGGEPRLEVGVGEADRELTALLHGDQSPTASLARVIDVIDGIRVAGAPPHPMADLVPERWLRTVLIRQPDLVGAAHLEAVASVRPRPNLRDTFPATAIGTAPDGRPLVVACSVGVDLELVPTAADDRAGLAPEADLVLAVPERDVLPTTRALAASLRRPATLVPMPDDWRAR